MIKFTKSAKIAIVISIAWVVIGYPAIYIHAKNSAQEIVSNICRAESFNRILGDLSAERQIAACSNIRREVYEKEFSNLEYDSALKTFGSLSIFLIIFFATKKAIYWIKKED